MEASLLDPIIHDLNRNGIVYTALFTIIGLDSDNPLQNNISSISLLGYALPAIITSSERRGIRSLLVFIVLSLLLVAGIIMPKFLAGQINLQKVLIAPDKINIRYSWINNTSIILNVTNHSHHNITLLKAAYGEHVISLDITIPANSSRNVALVLGEDKTIGLLRLTFIVEGRKEHKYLWIHR